jgi:hypothetical protein
MRGLKGGCVIIIDLSFEAINNNIFVSDFSLFFVILECTLYRMFTLFAAKKDIECGNYGALVH